MVVGEVGATHPDMLVQAVCFLYCVSMRYLLCNASDPFRFQRAFDLALGLCAADPLASFRDPKDGFSCGDGLRRAKKLVEEAEYNPGKLVSAADLGIGATPTAHFVNDEQGHYHPGAESELKSLKVAFVMSYYFLLKSRSEKNL